MYMKEFDPTKPVKLNQIEKEKVVRLASGEKSEKEGEVKVESNQGRRNTVYKLS